MDEKARLKSLKAYENELKASRREEFEVRKTNINYYALVSLAFSTLNFLSDP